MWETTTTPNGTESIAYNYDNNDRLTHEAKTTATASQVLTGYTWDANGNLSTKTIGSNVTVYLWNGDGRLVEVQQGGSVATAQNVARYTYDAQGNRVGKSEPGLDGQPDKMTAYVVDGTFAYAQTVQESVTQGDNSVVSNYVWGAGLIEQVRGGQATFYHADGLGSVKALTDSSGTANAAYQYDAFGVLESHTGSTANGYRYTGEYFDEAIGLQYNRARWYDPSAPRFISEDPFWGYQHKPHTLHKYAYVGNDPVNAIDPSGLMSLSQTSVANNIQSTLMSLSLRVGGLLNAYDRVNAVLGFLELIDATRKVFGDASSFGPLDASRSTALAGVNFRDAAESAAMNLPRAVGTGIGDWSKGYATSKQKGHKLTGALIYMPIVPRECPAMLRSRPRRA